LISFEGKVALVVGGTSGIGQATAEGFGRLGAQVVLAGRREDRGKRVAQGIVDRGGEASFVRADVLEEEQVEALVSSTVERYGSLDCAFNAATLELTGAIVDFPVADFDRVLHTSLRGAFLCVKHEMAAMARTGGGAIVNASSRSGTEFGVPTNGAYSAVKAGIAGLSRSAVNEGGPDGVRVNWIVGAHIRSEMALAAWESFGIPEERIASLTAIGRVGTPEDFANAVLFLCSDAAGFITGAELAVDGGWGVKPVL
jgi:NAD(P)-dependent dehydrogenase (short-subunit alcohol dehydrogenase family)